MLSYRYDAAGQLVERETNGAGQTVRLVRDARGAVVQRHAGDAVTTFAYDPAGRLVRATNADADVVVERDAAGRVVAETCNGRTVRSTWDGLGGRRTGRRTPRPEWTAAGNTASTAGRPRCTRRGTLGAGSATTRRAGRWSAGAGRRGRSLSQDWDPAARLLSPRPCGPRPTRSRSSQRTFAYRPDGAAVERIDDPLRGVRRFSLDASSVGSPR